MTNQPPPTHRNDHSPSPTPSVDGAPRAAHDPVGAIRCNLDTGDVRIARALPTPWPTPDARWISVTDTAEPLTDADVDTWELLAAVPCTPAAKWAHIRLVRRDDLDRARRLGDEAEQWRALRDELPDLPPHASPKAAIKAVRALRAEIERLTAGANPTPRDPEQWPSPGQLIADWNRADAPGRLALATAAIENAKTAVACITGQHGNQLAKIRHELDTLKAQLDTLNGNQLGHVIHITDQSWTISHPLTCPPFDCPVNHAAERAAITNLPAPGDYTCTLDDQGVITIGKAVDQ